MSVARVSRVFAQAGLELDARALAEALWLAGHLPSGPAAPAPDRDGAPVPADDEGAVAPPPAGEVEPVTDPPDDAPTPGPDPVPDPAGTVSPPDPPADDLLPLHLRPQQSDRAEANPAVPLLAHAAPAIPDTLRLMRSLRPLKRTVGSRHRLVLDEEATVRRIAERRIWLPVLQPAREPWLDLVLVADLGAGGQLWGRLAHELYGVFRRLGAFRDVRLRHLHTDAEGRPWVTTSGPGAGGAPRSPSELIDPTGRRLILLLTDGIGDAWRSGRLGEVVHRWGRSGPVAILQPLPAHLWERTALRPAPGRLGTPSPGAPNDRLSFVSYRRRRHVSDLPVPVLEIDAGWLAPWARLTSGNAQGGVDASVIFPGDAARGTPTERREPHDAFERVRAFRAEATPEAYELVTYLSAAPLSLPLMRTVQATMMPRSSPAHLAEILFSGLVATVSDGSAADDRYEFVDGVRDVLLGTLQRHEAERVDREVSAFIERWLRLPGAGLAAAVPTPSGALDLPAESRPFAKLRAEILARVAGIAAPAEDLDDSEGSEADGTDPVAAPSLPAEPVVGELLDARGQVVGSGFMVGPRYFATCAHVINAALGREPVAAAWPDGRVPVRIGGRAEPAHLAAIAAWPPHEPTFDQLDVAVLRIEGETPADAPASVTYGVPVAGEATHVTTRASSRTGRFTAVASDGLALLELDDASWSPPLGPMSGAPVWRPATGEIVGMVNGRGALAGARGETAVLPAAVVRKVVVDYLIRPRPAPPVSEPDGTTRGRHARPAATPPAASSSDDEVTQPFPSTFMPLNDVERRLLEASRNSPEDAVQALRSAQLWAPAGPSPHSVAELIAALQRRRPAGIGQIVLVTAPHRVVGQPSGPWSFGDVASVWPSDATMLVNPGTPIRIELTGIEVRALAPRPDWTGTEPISGQVLPPGEGPTWQRGQRFDRRRLRSGYSTDEVDAFAERIERTLAHHRGGEPYASPLTAQEVHDVVFRQRFNGYDEAQVDRWLHRVEQMLVDLGL